MAASHFASKWPFAKCPSTTAGLRALRRRWSFSLNMKQKAAVFWHINESRDAFVFLIETDCSKKRRVALHILRAGRTMNEKISKGQKPGIGLGQMGIVWLNQMHINETLTTYISFSLVLCTMSRINSNYKPIQV